MGSLIGCSMIDVQPMDSVWNVSLPLLNNLPLAKPFWFLTVGWSWRNACSPPAMRPAKKSADINIFLSVSSSMLFVISGCGCCLPSGCGVAVGSLCKIWRCPSISLLMVLLDPSFLLRCTSWRGGVDIVLLLLDQSLLLPFVMVDVCCFRCR